MSVLLDGFARASVLMLLALAAAAALRHRPAALRHWMLSGAFFCALAMPVLSLAVPAWPLPTLAVLAPRVPDGQAVAGANAAGDAGAPVVESAFVVHPIAEPAPARPGLGAIVVGVWGAGALVYGVLLAVAFVRLGRIAAVANRDVPPSWNEEARRIAQEINLRSPVTLLQAHAAPVLMTWGLFHPKVLLPPAAVTWSPERIRLVLRHEMAHIQRVDWIPQIASELVRCVHWFNPLVWLACRRLRAESERACDDVVLRAGADGAEYAAELLTIARHTNPGFAAPVPAMARRSSLEGRITAMLNVNTDRSPLSRRARIAAALLLLSLTAAVAGVAAQARFYTFSGTVLDSMNMILPGATVELTSASRGAKHQVQSDGNGRFELVGLPAGDYALAVRLPGFATRHDTIAVAGNIDRIIDLQLGSLEETVTITAAPAVDDPARAAARIADKLTAARTAAEIRRAAWLERTRQRCARGPVAGGVGGSIQPPAKIADVYPVYPPQLADAGIGGVVILEATIGPDGRVQEVRPLRSPHLELERSAIDAVTGWEFTPTLLNCAPVDVKMTVTVNFSTAR